MIDFPPITGPLRKAAGGASPQPTAKPDAKQQADKAKAAEDLARKKLEKEKADRLSHTGGRYKPKSK